MDPAARGGSDLVDTVAVLAEANTVLSSTYELVGPLEGGFQSGAWLIEDGSGQQAVLKWTPNGLWAEQIQRASRAVTVVREVSDTGVAGTELASHAAELLDRYQRPVFPTSDLVHGDFRLSNLLFDDDTVSGVIDIEALGSGTRVVDYATLLDDDRADDPAVELLVAAGSDVAGPAVLAYCLVHVVVDLARFMHRSHLTAVTQQADRRIATLSTRVQLVSKLLT